MVNRYLRLSSDEAGYIKKQISLSEENVLNILRAIRSYKLLRKKEYIEKNKLRLAVSALKSKISTMESTFPEEERREAIERQIRKERRIMPREMRDVRKMRDVREIRDMRKVKNFREIRRPNPIQRKKEIDAQKELEDIREKLARFSA